MTRIRYMSDLHLEFQEVEFPRRQADYTVLAGDIMVKGHALSEDRFRRLVIWLTTKCFSNVIYIPGNHEFYGGKMANAPYSEIFQDLVISINEEIKTRMEWRKTMPPRELIVLPKLDGSHIHLDHSNKLGFVGYTLWADFDGGNPISMSKAAVGMNDHHVISFWDSLAMEQVIFSPDKALELHRKSLDGMTRDIERIREDGLFPIVISHHAPSFQSVTPKYEGHALNGSFCSNLEEHPVMKMAGIWIHGHVHSYHDYKIGQCRVLCNSLGYPGENTGFNPYADICIL